MSEEIKFDRPGAAKYIGVETETLEKWAVTGRHNLSYIKVGKKVIYLKSTLDSLLKKQTIRRVDQ